jgi:hypothetical protein
VKTLLIVLLFATSAFAQNAPVGTAAAPGCGPEEGGFKVKSNDRQHPFVQPEPGKALVYFLQEDKVFESRPRPTVKWGVDGAWVGATQSNAYFYLSIEPGEHHLCSMWQTAVVVGAGHQAAAASLTAVAGGVYYFIARDRYWNETHVAYVKLEPLDPDEAQLLMSQFAFSTFQPKK